MRHKWIPSKADILKACRIKSKGGTAKDICQKLGIGFGQYEHNRHLFNSHYEQFSKAEKFKNDLRAPSPGAVKVPPKFSGTHCRGHEQKLRPKDIDLDVLRSYVICGFNREKIAGHLGISRTKLYLLQSESPDIEYILTRGQEAAAADILKDGLMRLCKEHKVKDTHFASHQGEIYSREYDKRFRPHLGAIKYLLSNTIGWQSESKPKALNNKGAILRMMDDIAGRDDSSTPAESETEESIGQGEDSDQRDDTPVEETETEEENQ